MTDDEKKAQDEKDQKKAEKHRLENDLTMQETEHKKLSKKVEAAENELRILQKQYTQLGFDIKDKLEEAKKGREKLDFLEEEIRVLKKRVNNL